MILDALADHELEREKGNGGRKRQMESPDLESIKSVGGLSFPPVVAEIRYSAKIKTDASFRLGAYTLIQLLKKAFKKDDAIEGEEKISGIGRRGSKDEAGNGKSDLFPF